MVVVSYPNGDPSPSGGRSTHPPEGQPAGRRANASGRKNTIKFTKICDEAGRTLRDGVIRPGRMHDQTALRTEGIDDLLEQFSAVE
jgi:hypothetical protein